MSSVLLPAAFAICASLGITWTDCSEFKINGLYQTNKTLWYDGISSYPDSDGVPPPSSCRDPIPIARYDIYDGTKGTTYACLAPLTDDQITNDELLRIGVLAHRLNSIEPKTLADHERALYLKNLVKTLSGEYP